MLLLTHAVPGATDSGAEAGRPLDESHSSYAAVHGDSAAEPSDSRVALSASDTAQNSPDGGHKPEATPGALEGDGRAEAVGRVMEPLHAA